MMLAMISGGIDLSLVGIANFSGITAAYIMVKMGGSPASILLGCIAAVIVGAICGCFNGFMIGYLQIPAMLVTLCGLQLYTGCGLMITKGPAITGLPEGYSILGNGTLAGVPLQFILFILGALWFHSCSVQPYMDSMCGIWEQTLWHHGTAGLII